MFALFFSLYVAMFRGTWTEYSLGQIKNMLTNTFNGIGTFLTSLFNNVETPMSTLGDILFYADTTYYLQSWISLVAFVLALITSIGIVVMAVKGVKRVFGVFFMGIRNI